MISTLLRLATLDVGGRVGVATRAMVLVLGAEGPLTNEELKEAMISRPNYSTARATTSPTVPDRDVRQTRQPLRLRNEVDMNVSYG